MTKTHAWVDRRVWATILRAVGQCGSRSPRSQVSRARVGQDPKWLGHVPSQDPKAVGRMHLGFVRSWHLGFGHKHVSWQPQVHPTHLRHLGSRPKYVSQALGIVTLTFVLGNQDSLSEGDDSDGFHYPLGDICFREAAYNQARSTLQCRSANMSSVANTHTFKGRCGTRRESHGAS